MNNLIYGVVTILVVCLIYFWAYKKLLIENSSYQIVAIALSGLVLVVYMSTDFYLHDWDERYHALVAKNLISNPFKPMLYANPVLDFDFREWASNHIWMHKQPLPLWSMAASMAVFGVNELALRLPSVLLFSTGIFVIYLLSKELFNKRVGLLAAFLYSINGVILEIASGRVATDHIDLFFMVFVLFSVYAAVLFFKTKYKGYNLLFAFFLGCAILSKWLPALVVIPVWLALSQYYNSYAKKELIIELGKAILVVVIVALPWQWYAITRFANEYQWESAYNMLHITEVLADQGGSWFYHFEKLRINYGELVYLPVLWFLYRTMKQKLDFRYWAISIWFLLPYLFFSAVATKMQGYTLFAAPAIFIMIATFIDSILRKEIKLPRLWLEKVIVGLLLILPIRFSVERLKPFEKRERNPAWVNAYKNFDENTEGEKLVVFGVNRPIEFMFYTSYTAYTQVPSLEKMNEILAKGYTVVINGDEANFPLFSSLNGVEIIQIEE
tara:strand:- start:82964 stop:84457 length:1494 start_codon:yes stop_codon:yes gene_type:complete